MSGELFSEFLDFHGIQKIGNVNYDDFHISEISKMTKNSLMENFMFDKPTAKKILDLLAKKNGKPPQSPARRFVQSLINKTFESSAPLSKFESYYKNVKDDEDVDVRNQEGFYMEPDVISAAYCLPFDSFRQIYKNNCSTSLFFGKKEYPSQFNSKGWTPLMYAATMQQGKIVEYLLSKGANLRLQEHTGKTALMLAASYGKHSIIKIMRDYGIYRSKLFTNKSQMEVIRNEIGLKLVDENSYTALHYAVYANQYDAVDVLMQLNADPEVLDRHGRSPLDYARDLPSEDILRLIQNHQKKL
uniref:Ankyrin repeat protein n=1 Tax=Panagrolaimus sp. JU765 TaxID=591449 RepID=A0AC34PWI8_9BILA